ncbi:hypothetical protein PRIPAC_89417 [Pristionchus pacificus]|uniref:tRNA synthetase n=1 Tax=Pristionchus pacificus TaxID=54126 RepID=A0A2A6CTY0_PRIPA|nr:hypothetical protein PRIPAC_89417 [Pristionchus pacificus]|eukprot:PDM81546.1 tRNA synthetase [Pristionchus pacificus]
MGNNRTYLGAWFQAAGVIVRRLPKGVYAGFDPTARSLHVGNLLILLNLFRSSKFDCQPIAIIGGATALVGDPSGRSTGTMKLLDFLSLTRALRIGCFEQGPSDRDLKPAQVGSTITRITFI